MKEFSVITLTREDFRIKGYDASSLEDSDMERIAARLGSIILDGGDFWIGVEIAAQELGLKVLNQLNLSREDFNAWDISEYTDEDMESVIADANIIYLKGLYKVEEAIEKAARCNLLEPRK